MACSTLILAATPENPKFTARYDLPGCYAGPGAIAIADINGDGIPDLICDGYGDPDGYGNVVTYLGDGNGTYRAGPISEVGFFGGGAPTPVDLNGDGKIDIVVQGSQGCCGYPIGLVVSLGNGDGTFQPGTFYQTGDIGTIDYITTGDFNGDGILDIATESDNSGIWILLGLGGGVFNTPYNIPNTLSGNNYQIAALDLNGDGKLDLIAGTGAGFGVLLGNGDGTFQPEMVKFVPFDGISFALGDFNGDGNIDLFFSSFFSTQGYLYLGEGNGVFHIALDRIVDLGVSGTVVAASDFNGDGFLDVATSAGQVLFGNGQGYFSAPVFYPLSLAGSGYSGSDVLPTTQVKNSPANLVFAESFIFSDYQFLCLLLNNGKGGFPEGASVSVSGGGAHCAVSGDFNRDGIPDLAVVVDSGLSVLLGTGEVSAPYTQGQQLSYGVSSCPVKGDLNGDGNPDLLVTTSANVVIAYLGNGDGTFSAAAKSTPIAGNGTLALGDFNGDGKVDFALTSNLLAYGNGDGTFQTPKPFIPKVVSSNIAGIASARLHEAATSDIVLTDNAANLVYVLLNNGGVFTQATFTPQQCAGPVNPVLADINGDGAKDLVTGCNGSTAPIYVNNGSGTFTFGNAVSFAVSAGAGYPLVTDVNGDAIPDLVIQGDSDLSVFEGQGGLLFAPPLYISSGNSPGHVLAVDAQGQKPFSGKPDLITPDTTYVNGQYSGSVNVFFNVTK